MNPFLNYAVRFGICIFLLAVYFYAWRPVRSSITQDIVFSALVKAQKNTTGQPYTIKRDGVALNATFQWGESLKNIQYRPQAGFFFLIAFMTLVIVGCDYKWYMGLIGLHLVSTVCTAGLMIWSKDGWYTGFILVDLIGTYLVPVLSLALAAWVGSEEQKNKKK